jgi:hypothetical protein
MIIYHFIIREYFAVCHDTENNSFGIWETNESAK